MHLLRRGNKWIYRRRWLKDVRTVLTGEFFHVALDTESHADAERRVASLRLETRYFAKVDAARAALASRAPDSRSPNAAEVHDIGREVIGKVLRGWSDRLETDILPPRIDGFDPLVIKLAADLFQEEPQVVEQAYQQLKSDPVRLRRLLTSVTPNLIKELQAAAITPDEGSMADAAAVFADQGIAPPQGDPSLNRLGHLIARGKVEALKLWHGRLNGDFGYRPADPAFADVLTDAPSPAQELTLAGLFDEFARVKAGTWSRQYKDEFCYMRRVAEDVLGRTRKLKAIRASDCLDVRDTFLALPANWTKKPELKELSPKRAAEKAAQLGIPGRMPGTTKKHITIFAAALAYAAEVDHITKSPATRLYESIEDPVRPEDKVKPFSVEQLRILFNSPLYRGCENDGAGYARPGPNRPRGDRFWLPLVLLFTGARLGEICQIELSDITVRHGVLCFSITTEDDDEDAAQKRAPARKQLKTEASKRMVPVHPELLRIGIEQRISELRAQGASHLFPSAKRHTDGKFHTMSKWSNRWLVKCGVKKSRKIVMHSFRHSFRDALREAELLPALERGLGGWASRDTAEIYGSGASVRLLSKAMNSVAYSGLDLSHLYPSAGGLRPT